MEWIDGVRLRSASRQRKADGNGSSAGGGTGTAGSSMDGGEGAAEDLRLVEVGVRCSLEQMLEEGFYHADPVRPPG